MGDVHTLVVLLRDKSLSRSSWFDPVFAFVWDDSRLTAGRCRLSCLTIGAVSRTTSLARCSKIASKTLSGKARS